MEADDLWGARPGAGHDVTIVPFGPSHVPEVARLHAECLTGLLSSLGPAAVRAYYDGACRARETCAFVAREEEQIVGFVMGSAHPHELRRGITRKNRTALVAGVLRGLVRRPSLLKWLVRRRRGADEGSYDDRVPELIYLAVSLPRRRTGAGRALVSAFTGAMKPQGASFYELSVDETNATAAAFYERLGFRRTGRYRELGVWHYRYRLELGGPPGAGPAA